MTKKSRKKIKYLENGKSFQDQTKSIFHHFKTFIKASKPTFLEGESPTLSKEMSNIYLKVTIEKKN